MLTFNEIVSWLIGGNLQASLMRLLGFRMHTLMENLTGNNVRSFMGELIGSGIEGNWFYYIAPVFALLLVIFWKKKRMTFAVPALIIMILVMNPVTKDLFEKVTELGYFWRLLWIVPIIPLCAALPGIIEEKIKKEYLKGFVAVFFAILFILLGSYTYDQRLCRFYMPANEEKIEQQYVDVADTLLTYDDNPHVVADAWPSVFLRQYTPKIRLLYGRDILGFGELSELGRKVYQLLGEGAFADIASAMLENGYEYLVTDDSEEGKQEGLKEAGFEFLTRVDIYGIYKIQRNSSEEEKQGALQKGYDQL